jgi:hypothetical protein
MIKSEQPIIILESNGYSASWELGNEMATILVSEFIIVLHQ